MRPNWISIGAALGALAVITGAFGAHALKDAIAPEALDIWRTAVLYHALHAIALVLYGLLGRNARRWSAGWSFLLGLLIFSGTLYGLALGGPRWLGMITPFGGGFLILGWILFALEARGAGASRS